MRSDLVDQAYVHVYLFTRVLSAQAEFFICVFFANTFFFIIYYKNKMFLKTKSISEQFSKLWLNSAGGPH